MASTGTDTGACPRTAPCRTFAYAMTQVSPGGEVVALDTAGYGPVTIPFAVSLYAAPGEVASITSTSGNDITIAAGPNDNVLIRGLFLNSNGSQRGISFDAGGVLSVQDTTFTNFTVPGGIGLVATRSTATDAVRVLVTNCRFFNNGAGIQTLNSAGIPIRLNVRNSTFEQSGDAIMANDATGATITDSTFAQNGAGVLAGAFSFTTAPGAVNVSLERCTFQSNAIAISSSNHLDALSTVLVAYCMITNNDTAITGQGNVLSRSDGTSNQTNTLMFNAAGNIFTGTYAAQ